MGSLDPRMRVRDIVAEPLVAQGTAAGPRARVAELLEAVGLPATRRTATRTSSPAASASASRSPARSRRGRDPRGRRAGQRPGRLGAGAGAQPLADLVEELGLTLVFVSHDLSVVRHVCDRVAVMSEGEIVETGSTEQVYAGPQHPYTRG